MKIRLNNKTIFDWKVNKIAIIGPGIVGMPMAALLADERIKIGTDEPAKVLVVQRNSTNSGWKVDAINSGRSVIGGIEPGLNDIVERNVADGILSATHDYDQLRDADVILISIQTDKKGFGPDYGPLFGGLTKLAEALQKKPEDKVPLIIFESTLAPSSMATVIREHFKKYGLIEGENILLGNSPNRVMPGRLVERVASSDKLVAGLHPETPKMIKHLYSHIVTNGELFETNSLTAEIEKTLENAYRDVRIAFATEIVRYCDDNNIDFYQVREKINERLLQQDNANDDPNAVPSGGLLIPMIGVGGHCLPKDGILLWWRKIESGADTSNSLIIKSRDINDLSPAETIRMAEKDFGDLSGKRISLLGAAYRFNSEDTRNSPTLALAKLLKEKGCDVAIHDPFVKTDDQNLMEYGFQDIFTNDMQESLQGTDYAILCTAHKYYLDNYNKIFEYAPKLRGVVDGCNIFGKDISNKIPVKYIGIGRGKNKPTDSFIDFVFRSFNAVEKGIGNELNSIIEFLNDNYAADEFNKARFQKVRVLADTCSTGCSIVNPDKIDEIEPFNGFYSELVDCAVKAQ
jgi:UDP-N-acetyl-D-mannosaminuronic acid dehydrogenase